MHVWRIEDSYGNGPNTCGFKPIEKMVAHTNNAKPHTRDDFGGVSAPFNAKFAFSSLEFLIDFYGIKTVVKLMELPEGYHITRYEAPRAVVSQSGIYVLYDHMNSYKEFELNEPRDLFKY